MDQTDNIISDEQYIGCIEEEGIEDSGSIGAETGTPGSYGNKQREQPTSSDRRYGKSYSSRKSQGKLQVDMAAVLEECTKELRFASDEVGELGRGGIDCLEQDEEEDSVLHLLEDSEDDGSMDSEEEFLEEAPIEDISEEGLEDIRELFSPSHQVLSNPSLSAYLNSEQILGKEPSNSPYPSSLPNHAPTFSSNNESRAGNDLRRGGESEGLVLQVLPQLPPDSMDMNPMDSGERTNPRPKTATNNRTEDIAGLSTFSEKECLELLQIEKVELREESSNKGCLSRKKIGNRELKGLKCNIDYEGAAKRRGGQKNPR